MSVLRAFSAFRAAAYRGGVKAGLRTRRCWGLGSAAGLVMDTSDRSLAEKGKPMAEEESILASPPTQDVAVHVRDYVRFTQMFKWSALVCLVIGLVVLLILK